MDLSTFRYTHNRLCLLIIIKFVVVLSHSQAKPTQAQFYDVFMYLSSERAAAAEQGNCSMLVILGFDKQLERGE